MVKQTGMNVVHRKRRRPTGEPSLHRLLATLAVGCALTACDTFQGVTLRGRLPVTGSGPADAARCLDTSFARHSVERPVRFDREETTRYDLAFRGLPFIVTVAPGDGAPTRQLEVALYSREVNTSLSAAELARRESILQLFAAQVAADCPGLVLHTK